MTAKINGKPVPGGRFSVDPFSSEIDTVFRIILTGTDLTKMSQMDQTNSTSMNLSLSSGVIIPEIGDKKTTSGERLDILLQQQWGEGAQARFKVYFLENNTIHEHQDYDFRILRSDGSELFSAANHTGQQVLHNVEGTITVPYRFQQPGNYTIQIYLAGTGIAPTIPAEEDTEFDIVVVPKFPLTPIVIAASFAVSIVVLTLVKIRARGIP